MVPHWQTPYLGLRFLPKQLTGWEIDHFFTLQTHERDDICQRFRGLNRLAVALQWRACQTVGNLFILSGTGYVWRKWQENTNLRPLSISYGFICVVSAPRSGDGCSYPRTRPSRGFMRSSRLPWVGRISISTYSRFGANGMAFRGKEH